MNEEEFGNKVFDQPKQIKVRWEDKTEEFLDKTGNTLISRSQVFVDRKIEERSVLWKGTFATVQVEVDDNGNPDPFVNDDAFEVRQYAEQPDFKAKKFLRYVML